MGDLAGHATLGDFDEGALLATARELVGREASALETTAARLDGSLIEAARMALAATGKVITAGVGTNGPIARRLAGTPAVHDGYVRAVPASGRRPPRQP